MSTSRSVFQTASNQVVRVRFKRLEALEAIVYQRRFKNKNPQTFNTRVSKSSQTNLGSTEASFCKLKGFLYTPTKTKKN